MADSAWREDLSKSTASRSHLLGDAAALAHYLRPQLVVPSDLSANGHVPGAPSAAFPHANPPRNAAVLAPLYARAGEPWLLFTRRAAGLSRHSGEISFPGGSHDPTDSSLAYTALRESREELSLDETIVRLLGALPPVYSAVSNFVVTPFIGWLGEGLPQLTPAHTEVAEIIEAPLGALDDVAIFHEEVWTRNGESHTVYFYDFGAYRIWGLTARILHQLLNLLPGRE